LDEYHIYTHNEIDRFADIFFSGDIQTANDLGKLSATLIPALDRFKAKNDDEKDEFKATLATFIRIYAFITQVCRMFDKEMHKFNVYVRFLQKVLPKGKQHNVDLDDKILMEYYRLEKNFEGSIELEGSEKGITPIKGEAGRKEQKKDMLAQIIERINERFGTTFTEMDKVMLQIENDFLGEERLVNFAKNNDENVFKLIFEQEFKEKAAARYEMNEEFFVHMFNDCDFMQYMMDLMRSDIYKKLRKQGK
jgi:type I restriction enzyme R subunit